jgi:hypothetical protein
LNNDDDLSVDETKTVYHRIPDPHAKHANGGKVYDSTGHLPS